MKSLFTAALTLAAALATPAYAEQGPSTRMVIYQDLDLATHIGQSALQHRVWAAAGAVCDPENVFGASLPASIALQQCRHHAYSAAQPQIQLAFDHALHGTVQMAAAREIVGITVAGGR